MIATVSGCQYSKRGEEVIITNPESIELALDGKGGTRITK